MGLPEDVKSFRQYDNGTLYHPRPMRLPYSSHSRSGPFRGRCAVELPGGGTMTVISRSKISWLLVTFGITLVIILTTIFSLKSGYQGIFPYFYILPILLLAYIFPRYSVYFTIVLGWVYLTLVYMYRGI